MARDRRGGGNKKLYVWQFRNQHHAYFAIEDSRSGEVPLRVLVGASNAFVVLGYSGYSLVTAEQRFYRVQ